MRIRISNHAREQIRRRSLRRNDVFLTVRLPDRRIEQTVDRFRVSKLIQYDKQEYAVIVIYDQLPAEIVVVTAFRSSKLEKYL